MSWLISLCVVLLNVAYVLGIWVGNSYPGPVMLTKAVAITFVVALVAVIGCTIRAVLDRFGK